MDKVNTSMEFLSNETEENFEKVRKDANLAKEENGFLTNLKDRVVEILKDQTVESGQNSPVGESQRNQFANEHVFTF